MKATREQVKIARRLLEMLLEVLRDGRAVTVDASCLADLEVIFTATAEPSEEELREEAVAAVLVDCGLEGEEAAEVRAHILDSLPYASDNVDHTAEARAYIRGARREGLATTTEGGAS